MQKLVWVLTLVALTGCQLPGSRRSSSPQVSTNSAPQATQVASAAANEQTASTSPFSLGNIWKAVTFQTPGPEGQPGESLVPQEVVQLGNVIQTVAARAQELNVQDPPEVTKQKAQAILESLRPWDAMLGAGQSVGLISDRGAAVLNSIVGRLKAKVQELVEYVPNAQTIGAVKYLAGQLHAAYTGTIGAFSSAGRNVQ